MITISLEEKNAKLILNLLKSRMDDIDGQIKQLENDKKEIIELIDNFNPVLENSVNPIVNNPIPKESEFTLKEIEFDEESLPEVTFGKNKIRRSGDGQKIYLGRNGYRAHIKVKFDDLIYLQEHPFEIENAISNLSKNKTTVLARILKEIDFNKLDLIFQSCPSENKQDQKENQNEKREEEKEEDQIKNQDNQDVEQKDEPK